jgi:hypothetical protein
MCSLWIYENETSYSPSPFGKPEERSTQFMPWSHDMPSVLLLPIFCFDSFLMEAMEA